MPLWKQALLRRTYREAASEGEGGSGGSNPGESKPEPKPGESEGGSGVQPPAKKPTDEEARLLRENMQRKEKLAQLSAELEAQKALTKQLEELGGLDAVRSLVAAQREAESKALEAKGDWERLRARMAEENARAVAAATEKATATAAALEAAQKTINDLTVGNAFSTSKVIAEELTYTPNKARILFGGHFEVVDGKIVGYDKPRGESNRTPLVDGSGTPLGFEDAMKKIVEADPERETYLRNKMKPGADSSSRTKPAPKVAGAEHLTGVDRIAAGLNKLAKG